MDWRDRLDNELPRVTGDPKRDGEIREELAVHCADRFEELRTEGADPVDAERQVMAEVRDLARRAAGLETALAAGPGEAAGGLARFVTAAGQDARYALRLLWRTPGFAASAVLTLALAVGVVAAIFSIVDGVLLRQLPYGDPDGIVYVWEVSPQGDDHNVVSSGNYLAWRERTRSFSTLGAISGSGFVAMTGQGDPVRIRAASVSPSTLEALRIVPRAGQLFSPDEGIPGGPPVALLGESFWRARFGADPSVVGRSITIDGDTYTVQGVLPDGQAVPQLDVDVVTPLRFDEEDRTQFRSHNYRVVGRLAPGVTRAEAEVEMRALATSITTDHPEDMTGWGVSVVGAHADLVRSVRPLLVLLAAAVVLVLLVACANLANLQIARAASRGGEMAVRAAIGARRSRLLGQLMAESVTLSVLGGVVGVMLGWWLTRLLVAAAPSDIPLLDAVVFNWRAVMAAAVATGTSAVLVGLLPALQTSRTNLQPLLHGSRIQSGAGEGRLRLLLVAAQVALATVVLVAAVLLTRSFVKLNAVEHGFDVNRLLVVELDLPGVRYPNADAQAAFYRELLDRLRRAPGVRSAASTSSFPGAGAGMTFSYGIEGRPAPSANGREDARPLQAVSPGYFEAMAIPVVEGRSFQATDDARGLPVVVINRALAALHWPDSSPIGQRLSARPGQTPWLEVVGVVGDTRDEGLDAPAPPTLYLPFDQAVSVWGWMTWQNFVIRTVSDPASVTPLVADTVWALDSELPLLNVSTMASAFAENAARRRFAMQMLAGFAAVAVLLGAIGIYGVLACGVSERRQEIGVRLALGARPSQVALAVLRPVFVVACVGGLAGLGVSVLAARFLESLLFGVEAGDPASLAAVVALLAAVSAAAAWKPLRRAAQLDPVQVLRRG